MYLGIDFLITADLTPYTLEINLGLPGGAQEYHLTHLVYFNRPPEIFKKIEQTSQRVYGKPFKEYLNSFPFIEILKPFKIWMDGMGPFPEISHAGLRLEDKWVQYQLINRYTLMPETMIFDPLNLHEALQFFEKRGEVVLKRRLGRGGRGLQKITDPQAFSNPHPDSKYYLLQKFIESKIDGYNFSIRSVAFGGEFMCMYANLSSQFASNHGTIVFVSPGENFGLAEKDFKTESFSQKSWEARLWFGDDDPPYLKHNLYEDVVARTTLCIPRQVYEMIIETSVRIERIYEKLDLSILPEACFEE